MNQSFISDILYADIESKAKELTVNSNNTVQPVALMLGGIRAEAIKEQRRK